MKALRVGIEFYVNAEDIGVVQPWPSRPAKREREAAIRRGTYYDATGGKKILALVTTRDGWVIASALTPSCLIQRPVVAAPLHSTLKRAGREAEEVPLSGTIEVLNFQDSPAPPPVTTQPLSARADNGVIADTARESNNSSHPTRRGFFPRRR